MYKAVKILVMIVVAFMATTMAAFAEDSTGTNAYVIDSYQIDVHVNENNTLNITESIGAYFNQPKHGIIRNIPLKNKVVRLDGTTSNNRATISNIQVNDTYATAYSNGEKSIKIGTPNATIVGQKNYTISYTYNLGRDTGKNYDEFYFNLIGGDWDTTVGNVAFSIYMPKEFNIHKIELYKGPIGSTDNTGIQYRVEDNAIRGSYNGVLNPGEALTVRIVLPDGYFSGASSNFDFMTILSFGLPILFALLTICLWVKYGKDEHVVETVEFYPPEGFNSAELGFLYKGEASGKDVVSLLVYLANKGYLKISELEEHSLFTKSKTFKLTKLKPYDGDNENERIFLSGLFSTTKKLDFSDLVGLFKQKKIRQAEDRYEDREEVTSEELSNSFYITANKIIQNLNKKENRYKIFEKSSMGKGLFFALLVIGIYALITIKPVIEYGGTSSLLIGLVFPGIGFTVLFGMVFGKTKISVKIFGLVWGLGFGGMPWAMNVLPALLMDPFYVAAYITGLLCVFVIVMVFQLMPKRTVYGNELLGKIKGFRNFLELAEKPQLEKLVLQDPMYFYNNLSFAYVLGVSDKWIAQFENIVLQAPAWYEGNSDFHVAAFGAFMNSTMYSAATAMSSGPSGGGSGGGGSSGGGSGGGGGSSW